MLSNKQLILKAFFFAVFLESIAVLGLLAFIPSDIKHDVLFGFSVIRLLLMGIPLGMMLLAVAMFFLADRLVLLVDRFLSDIGKQAIQALAMLFIFGLGILFLCVPVQRIGEAQYQRSLPLVGLILLVSLQILVGQHIWIKRKLNWEFFLNNIQALRISGAVLLAFVFLWIFIVYSGLGIERESSGWLSPGTPILPQQLLFCMLVGVLFFVFRANLDKQKKMDYLIVIFIWLAASLMWLLQPMLRQSYFSPQPTPPNFEYYPYSDAAHYDWFAQSILIGSSRNIGLTHRPLYSFFLALLHFIVGSGLRNVLVVQVLILAVIPVIVYFLVLRLGGRSAGIVAAMLLIFRERNSIALTNIIEVSHVKLIMSDVPTMLTMVLFVYFYVKWFQERKDKYTLGVIAGACLGFSIFIRSQAQLLIPISLAGLILIEKFNWRSIFRKSVVFLLGLMVVLVPWVWRNYQLSGRVIVEYLDFYTRFIASSYSSSPGDADMLANETEAQYRDRVKKQVIDYIVDYPLEVSHSYASYFLHNEVASLTYLPMSIRFDTLDQYIDRTGFWRAPYLGAVPLMKVPALFIIVCMVSLGIGMTFHRFNWVGIMPLFFHLGYNFSSVFVHQSGWRFVLPVDWIVLLYFCIGLSQAALFTYTLVTNSIAPSVLTPVTDGVMRVIDKKGLISTIGIFALLGLAFPIIEWSISERYPPLPNESLIQNQVPDGLMLDNGKEISTQEIRAFLKEELGAVLLYGRALYPSFYEKGEYWGDSNPVSLEASQYSRLQFSLIGPNNGVVFLPTLKSPQYFPHASDVLIIGCQQTYSIKALVVKVNDRVLTVSPWVGLKCLVME